MMDRRVSVVTALAARMIGLSMRTMLTMLTMTVMTVDVAAAQAETEEAFQEEVAQAIIAAIRDGMGPEATVEVEALQVEGVDEGPVLALPGPGARVGRAVVFMLTDPTSGRRSGRATADLLVSVPHARARRALARGSDLDAADLELVRGPVEGLPIEPLPAPEDLVGGRVLRDIPSGGVVSEAGVRVMPAVRSGQTVSAIVRIDGVEVTARLVAMQSGARGSSIRVVNRESRRQLRAVVVSDGVVEVIP